MGSRNMMQLCIMFDSGSEVSRDILSTTEMVVELATVLLGACIGAVAVLYAAPRGYLGHRKRKASTAAMSIDSYAPAPEHADVVQYAEAPAAAEPAPAPAAAPAPSPAPALYESVQPAPAPVTYSSPTPASFGAPSLAKKPTRTYRRRTAPIRGASGTRTPRTTKPKKR
jgi:hypothetical protein